MVENLLAISLVDTISVVDLGRISVVSTITYSEIYVHLSIKIF